MNKNIFSKVFAKCLLPAMAVCVTLGQQSCLDDYAPGNYYTFTGETVASFLENGGNDGLYDFSNFIYALQQAGIWGEMKTYGEYTCFAPTNDGFGKYLSERGVTSVEQLTKEQCDTIAYTHIINHSFFCKDLSDGALPYANMMDRYLVYTTDSARADDGSYRTVYRLNQSYITERDDSVVNGVVHVIAEALNPSNKFLPDVMQEDDQISIFTEALFATKLSDSLSVYKDPAYSISVDSIVYSNDHKYGTSTEVDYWVFPEFRYFKFTAFAETDKVMNKYNVEGLGKDAEDEKGLIHYAIGVYDPDRKFAKDGELSDEDLKAGYYNLNDYTNRNHPLNKFVAYHLLPEELQYNYFNIVDVPERPDYKNSFCQWAAIDVEDFYETMLPHSVMRISTPQIGGKYINRKGAPGDQFEGEGMIPGVRITKMSGDNTAINGVYHYINDMLLYNDFTRKEALNTRMRIMCSTLSPDFINSGGRGRYSDKTNGGITYGHKAGFCKNVVRTEQTQAWVRYYNPVFTIFRSDEVTIRGLYDISFKIPPVPDDGVYELRMFMCTLTENAGTSDRGYVQVYLGEQEDGAPTSEIEYTACDIPVDLAINPSDPRIGWIKDDDCWKELTDPSEEEKNAAIQVVDKQMRNRGYMKGMDSYQANYGTGSVMRERTDCVRKILTTGFFSTQKNYWFRIRLVTDDPNGVCAFNCIEMVPKSVYANPLYPEDRH